MEFRLERYKVSIAVFEQANQGIFTNSGSTCSWSIEVFDLLAKTRI